MIYSQCNSSYNSSIQEQKKKDTYDLSSQNNSAKEYKNTNLEHTQLLVWGFDSSGQLGLGQKQQGGNCYFSPKFCYFNISIDQISCGLEHSSFLTNNGNVYLIGSNKQGQLGIGSRDTLSRSVPVLLDCLAKHTIVQISCGGNHTGVISSRGLVFMWGEGINGQLGTGIKENLYQPTQLDLFNVRFINCGKKNTIVLQGQKAFGFGECKQGQLGTGKKVNEYSPAEIPIPSFEGHIKSVSCGDNHTLFLTDLGETFACGNNDFGQLGIGKDQKTSLYLQKVQTNKLSSNFQSQKIIAVQSGYSPTSLAISQDGKLFIWGTGFFGYYDEPQLLNEDSIRWKGCSLGNNFISLLDDQGRVYSWGQNINGELGLGENSSYQQSHPKQIEFNMNDKIVQKIESGSHYSFAILTNKPTDINNQNFNSQEIYQSGLKKGFILNQQRTSINQKHAILAEQINQFSQQLQKFQNDYPSPHVKNIKTQNYLNQSGIDISIDKNQQENCLHNNNINNNERKYYKNNNSQNDFQEDNTYFQNIMQNSNQLNKRQRRSMSSGQNYNSQNETTHSNNIRCNTQYEIDNHFSNSNSKRKLDSHLPNHLSNNIPKPFDFYNHLNSAQEFNQKQINLKNQLDSSLLSNNSLQSSTYNNINNHNNHLLCKEDLNQSQEHKQQREDNILNICDIVITQPEIKKEKKVDLQNPFYRFEQRNQHQKQEEQMNYSKERKYINLNNFLQTQENSKSIVQQSFNNEDFIKMENAQLLQKIAEIQNKYDKIEKQLQQSQNDNKNLKQQLQDEKNKNVNLKMRIDQQSKKIKQIEKKNELLLLEIDMNKKMYEMKCEAMLKQLYQYQSLEPTIQCENSNSNLNQLGQNETLLDNFITINENGINILDISNSQIKNLQTFAEEEEESYLQYNKENIRMNIQQNQEQLKLQSQKDSKISSKDYCTQTNQSNNLYLNCINTNTFEIKDFLNSTSQQSPFSTTNASKKLAQKINQLNLINRSNQIDQSRLFKESQ